MSSLPGAMFSIPQSGQAPGALYHWIYFSNEVALGPSCEGTTSSSALFAALVIYLKAIQSTDLKNPLKKFIRLRAMSDSLWKKIPTFFIFSSQRRFSQRTFFPLQSSQDRFFLIACHGWSTPFVKLINLLLLYN